MKLTELGEVCEHGQLKRQCPICERDMLIAEFEDILRDVEAFLSDAVKYPLADTIRDDIKDLLDRVRGINK